MSTRRGRHECVVDSASGDPARRKFVEQVGGCFCGEEPGGGEVLLEEPLNGSGRSAGRGREPGQHGERLEGGVTGESETEVGNGVEHTGVVLVVSDHQGHRDAGIDE